VLQFNLVWNTGVKTPTWTCTDGYIDTTSFYPNIFENNIWVD